MAKFYTYAQRHALTVLNKDWTSLAALKAGSISIATLDALARKGDADRWDPLTRPGLLYYRLREVRVPHPAKCFNDMPGAVLCQICGGDLF